MTLQTKFNDLPKKSSVPVEQHLVTVHLPTPLYSRFMSVVKEADITKSALMRLLIEQGLDELAAS
jgi:hypothetical protein